MDITITLSDPELLRIATAIKGNKNIQDSPLTDTQIVTATIEEMLKGYVKSFERDAAVKIAITQAVTKADTEVLPGRGVLNSRGG